MNFYGVKIIIQPEVIEVRRTWRERLLTRPWRPLLATKVVPNPALLPDGQTALVGDTLEMNARTASALRAELRRRGKFTEAATWPAGAPI